MASSYLSAAPADSRVPTPAAAANMSSSSSSSSSSRFEQQHDRDAGREPCPDRIVEDLGGAFGMGCVGGFLWHFVRGARNSPKGERFAGAMFAATSRAPILGGNFAVWGGTFSTFDCTLQYIRRTDDHWNNIASGFLTGGVLAARAGWKQAGKSAVMGGVILTVIEGVAALLTRSTVKTPRDQALEMLEMERQQKEAEAAGAPPPGGFFGSGAPGFGSMFGGGAGGAGGSPGAPPAEGDSSTLSWFSSLSSAPPGVPASSSSSGEGGYFVPEAGSGTPPTGSGGAPSFS